MDLKEQDAIDADCVLLMDVFGHADGVVGLLADYIQKAPSAARFMITVPAFQWLWGGHDVFPDRRRRSTPSDLDRIVPHARPRPLRRCCFFAGIFPLVASLCFLDRPCAPGRAAPRSSLKGRGGPVNARLMALCMAEVPLMRINRLAGVSALHLCEKA